MAQCPTLALQYTALPETETAKKHLNRNRGSVLRMTMIQQQAGKMGHPLMNLLRLNGTPILQQLQLEEKLLRTSSDNWCIINDGTDTPAIVMGVSGKPSELLEIGPVLRDRVPVIRRFTGGGTVIVDSGTVFITLICNKDAVPGVQPYPVPSCLGVVCCIMKCFEGLVISNSGKW
ncbi:hypothetical protein LWI29_023982 [Acer saccharum]|uniref:BPL/LPL catalytic domain-containing protein n=1 Tax=Acer saccharum TaxID=4024 RepID=A0AA39S946_ACESA|nr:hypothetical protein LWI29_023982 [Acer saccharum]